ncbi:sensor domain-containing diguanylate cyclase [Vibrio sp. TRT 29B02]|uniref:sensor domain-containing diguanylate cyclase n=2 Tax=unclassified Vibrio TaxID=2614977 RepID=UPI003CE7C21D
MHKLGSKLFIQFTLVFCAMSLVPFLYFYTQFNQLNSKTEQFVEQLNRNKLEYAKAELQTSLQQMTSSLRYLSNNGMINQTITDPSNENIDSLEQFWLLIARTQSYYSRLRLMDNSGMEIVRINIGERFTEIVNKNSLQYKGDRDYFRYAKNLANNDVGHYGIDIESENGQPVSPLVPAYRIIYPLTIDGERKGYFIANLDLQRIYRSLAYKRNSLNLPNIVTSEGYYLMSSGDDKLLGNIVQANASSNIALQYPRLWNSLKSNSIGTIKDKNFWLSYTTVELDSVDNIDTLIFFTKTSLSEAHSFTSEQRRDLYLQATFISIILLLLTFTFVTWNHNHEKNSIDSKIARAAMNGMSAMVITDRNNRIIQVNDEFTRVSGYKLEDVKGQPPSLFASGKHQQEFYMNMWKILETQGLWEGEVVNRRRDGSLITEILRIQTVKDRYGIIQFYVASFVDISHRKELENRLRELSEKDAMTSLWNRRKFDSEMQTQVQRTKRYKKNEVTALALLDIDHFKRINDTYGHDCGDQVIKSVAQSLTHHLRETDIIARIGGEEFAIIMPHTSLREAEVVVNRLRTAIHLESELKVTVSAGLTEISHSSEQSYKRADIALYESKSSGRNRVSILPACEASTIA